MSYLKDFLTQINNRDFHKFLVLWEEYCTSDSVDTEEFSQLLKAIKSSDLALHFGQIIETALPLWKTINDKKEAYEIMRLLMDLQTTNSPVLVEIATTLLKETHGADPKFAERIRLAGLRDKEGFLGALSKYDLIAHMAKNNIVFHTGGWGTGEIVDLSFIREHVTIEFENVSGKKDISFSNAFKTIIPLPHTHFLARRFANPDLLEKEGREDPLALIQLLLRDLGPKTATEIKDELSELVIPQEEWAKWWQLARTKIKKSGLVEWPESTKEPFYLRKNELVPVEQFQKAISHKKNPDDLIAAIYSFSKDTPAALKDAEAKKKIHAELLQLLSRHIEAAQEIQVHLLLEQLFGEKTSKKRVDELVCQAEDLKQLIDDVDIVAFKKQILIAIKGQRDDWTQRFCDLLCALSHGTLRDYLVRELNSDEDGRALLKKKLKFVLDHPATHPEFFVWYFQKIIDDKGEIPYGDDAGRHLFFEHFFILYAALESRPEEKDLLKKMYNLLSAKRYALVRDLLKGTTLNYAKELLLLISKCQTLSDHDVKILRSLTEVVHPSLAAPKSKKEEQEEDQEEIWTTEAGYLKIQERIKHIGCVEVVENAREIEAARALGDLRENSEFKFAQEKRARLQSELKTLSDQFGKARIITPNDIHPSEVGIGSVVSVVNPAGKEITYTILGPWDADVDKNILSINSKLAQAMLGKKAGSSFKFRDEQFKILNVKSYL